MLAEEGHDVYLTKTPQLPKYDLKQERKRRGKDRRSRRKYLSTRHREKAEKSGALDAKGEVSEAWLVRARAEERHLKRALAASKHLAQLEELERYRYEKARAEAKLTAEQLEAVEANELVKQEDIARETERLQKEMVADGYNVCLRL